MEERRPSLSPVLPGAPSGQFDGAPSGGSPAPSTGSGGSRKGLLKRAKSFTELIGAASGRRVSEGSALPPTGGTTQLEEAWTPPHLGKSEASSPQLQSALATGRSWVSLEEQQREGARTPSSPQIGEIHPPTPPRNGKAKSAVTPELLQQQLNGSPNSTKSSSKSPKPRPVSPRQSESSHAPAPHWIMMPLVLPKSPEQVERRLSEDSPTPAPAKVSPPSNGGGKEDEDRARTKRRTTFSIFGLRNRSQSRSASHARQKDEPPLPSPTLPAPPLPSGSDLALDLPPDHSKRMSWGPWSLGYSTSSRNSITSRDMGDGLSETSGLGSREEEILSDAAEASAAPAAIAPIAEHPVAAATGLGILSSPAPPSPSAIIAKSLETGGGFSPLNKRASLTRFARSNSTGSMAPSGPYPLSATPPSGMARSQSGVSLSAYGGGTSPVKHPLSIVATGEGSPELGTSAPRLTVSSDMERGSSAGSLFGADKSNRPLLKRRPTTSGSVGAVGSFFSGLVGGSKTQSPLGSPADEKPNEFGALFEKGSGVGRKRGSSVSSSLFGALPDGRKRGASAGSSTQHLASFLDPASAPPSAGPSSPNLNGGFSSRARSSTDPKRFSMSSNASSRSSLAIPNSTSTSFSLYNSVRLLHPPPELPGSPSPASTPNLATRRGDISPSQSRKTSVSIGSASGRPNLSAGSVNLKAVEDETAEAFLVRVTEAAGKAGIAKVLASSGVEPYPAALASYFATFRFEGDPLDVALRKLLMEATLPTETQQIDRVMEAFAVQYNTCNPGLFASSDTPYILAFSLVMLSTDLFNPSNKNRMTKADYCKNTPSNEVSTEILEYFYDQMSVAPFMFVEDELDLAPPLSRNPDLNSSTSSLFSLGTAQKEKTKHDPYLMISQGLMGELRVNVEARLPLKTQFSSTGTVPFFNTTALHNAFVQAPILQVESSRSTVAPTPAIGEGSPSNGLTNLRVTMVGLLSRKDDLADGGKKASSRKWKSWSVILTGSQLVFFKDPIWAEKLQETLKQAYEKGAAPDSEHVLVFPPLPSFKPDAVLSLANAVAVYDSTYTKYRNVFRLAGSGGRQYLFQASSEEDMNAWLAHINYAAAFKTANIRMRTLHGRRHSLRGKGSRSAFSPEPLPVSAFPSSQGETGLGLSVPVSTQNSTLGLSSLGPKRRGSIANLLQDPIVASPPQLGDVFAANDQLSIEALVEEASGHTLEQRQPERRSDALRLKVAEFDEALERIKKPLQTDLRLTRNYAILTPFFKGSRDRILAALPPLERRIRQKRLELAKVSSYREVLARDLLVEDREEERTRKSSSNSSAPSSSFSGMVPFKSTPPRQIRRSRSAVRPPSPPSESESDAGTRDSFESAVEGYASDGELDRLRSPPMLQRSTTETNPHMFNRFDRGSSMSDDELPPTNSFKNHSPTTPRALADSPETPRPGAFANSPSWPTLLSPTNGHHSKGLPRSPADTSPRALEEMPSPEEIDAQIQESEEDDYMGHQWESSRARKGVSVITLERLDEETLTSLIQRRSQSGTSM